MGRLCVYPLLIVKPTKIECIPAALYSDSLNGVPDVGANATATGRKSSRISAISLDVASEEGIKVDA